MVAWHTMLTLYGGVNRDVVWRYSHTSHECISQLFLCASPRRSKVALNVCINEIFALCRMYFPGLTLISTMTELRPKYSGNDWRAASRV